MFTCDYGQDESNDEQNECLHCWFDEQVEEEVIRGFAVTTVILYSSGEREIGGVKLSDLREKKVFREENQGVVQVFRL